MKVDLKEICDSIAHLSCKVIDLLPNQIEGKKEETIVLKALFDDGMALSTVRKGSQL